MSFLSAAILPKEGGRLLTTSERKMQMMSLLTRPTILIHELYKLPQKSMTQFHRLIFVL